MSRSLSQYLSFVLNNNESTLDKNAQVEKQHSMQLEPYRGNHHGGNGGKRPPSKQNRDSEQRKKQQLKGKGKTPKARKNHGWK
ncbi:hypothetical protein GN244_ATG17874 [Phytophthora infestans]|uniref:Uncharacterized protein n=1 Tax=Phytophthora infestans TaxID=4787 RepID=A0A833WKQ8_PHYIN|nr:hypothetical protein GN244_ATG17874 [Phytophthora infestans]KAF4131268.1 hypothetical protein GN958_ATG19523 [Phytophthora infestans]